MKKFLTILFLLIATPALAGSIFPYPRFQAIDGNGNPIRGGKIYFYEAGTTTAKDAYSDRACSSAISNPFTLDSNGEATIYLCGNYKINLKTSAGAQVPGWPLDNQEGMNASPTLGVSLDDVYDCDLDAAVTAIGSTVTYLTGDCSPAIADGETVTINANTTIDFTPGNKILGTAGGGTETLAVNGEIICGDRQQCFDSSTLTVTGLTKSNPFWFGAAGDGITDDTVAIQAAASFDGGEVYFPQATYLISDEIVQADSSKWVGAGRPNYTEILAADANAQVTMGNSSTIEGIYFLGSNDVAGARVGTAIYAEGSLQKLSGIKIKGFDTGLRIASCINLKLDKSYILDNRINIDFNGADAGAITNDVTFSDDWVRNAEEEGIGATYTPNRTTNIRVRGGIYEDNGSSDPTAYAQIKFGTTQSFSVDGVYFETDDEADALKISGAVGGEITGCYFNGHRYDIYATSSVSDIFIAGNRAANTVTNNIKLDGTPERITDISNLWDSTNSIAGTGAGINEITNKIAQIPYNGESYTPALSGSGTAGTPTYTVQVGSYSIVGNQCYFSGKITITAKTAIAGDLQISLPQTAANYTNRFYIVPMRMTGITASGGNTYFFGRIDPNTDQIVLYQGGSTTSPALTDSELGAAATFDFSGVYEIVD